MTSSPPTDTPPVSPLGSDLRTLRKARGMTLQRAAAAIERSVGWLSQVERGIGEPALSDLRRLAALYDAPLSLLFRNDPGPEHERAHIVRKAARRPLGLGEDGFTEELLSPDLGGAFELFRSEMAPGAASPGPVLRPTEEGGYVVSGRLRLRIGDRWHALEPGDSFRFAREEVEWRNEGDVPCVVIWAVAPPVY